MKPVLLILLAGLFIALSCKTNTLNPIPKECENCITYKSFILKNWGLDSTGYFKFKGNVECLGPEYIKEKYAYSNLMGRQCFKGQSIDSIVKYFGNPTVKTANQFDYYMSKQCEGKELNDIAGIRGCIRLRVYFDEKKIVVGMSSITREQ